MPELKIKIEKTKKDYYKVTLEKENKMFYAELERSEIRHIIGVLDNTI
tara:strand:- start:1023 stop:1166 length:144 start_codon:yes stop_codon:yes gene_type:complete